MMMKSQENDYPQGTIVHRVIRGKDRYYHQWRENGKTMSRYLKPHEVLPLRERIEERKRLFPRGTGPLPMGTGPFPTGTVPVGAVEDLRRRALTGKRLLEFAHDARALKPRFACADIRRFLAEATTGVALIVNGPPASGKTTLLKHVLAGLSAEERARTIYLDLGDRGDPADVSSVLTLFRESGVDTVFLENAPEASTFGHSDMRFVLTANLPLPALFSKELADAFAIIDLSFIPYAEQVHLFGDRPLSDYIENGGVLVRRLKPTTTRGLSLPLQTTLRGIEARLNDLFLAEILDVIASRPKESRRRRESFVGADITRIAKRLSAETGEATEDDARMREILLTVPCGLRYRHLRERVLTLLDDPVTAHLGAAERRIVRTTILEEIRQRLFEDIVWHELSVYRTSETVFVERLRFGTGSYGFVIADREELTCELVVVALSETRDDRQLRYLNDPLHLERIEHRYGIVTSRDVVYLGRNARHGTGVAYRNAKDYLIRETPSPSSR